MKDYRRLFRLAAGAAALWLAVCPPVLAQDAPYEGMM
ncbi:TIGR02301 family protein, partial [Brucella melitensis]